MYNISQVNNILTSYFPESIAGYVSDIIEENKVHFRLSRPRKTKLGDFKADIRTGKCMISVNNDLPFPQFLITTIHELAHVVNWKRNGRSVAPHGKEWKNIYKELFEPVIPMLQDENFKQVMLLHIAKPKASSFSDLNLMKYLAKDNSKKRVEDVPFDTTFQIGKKTFVKTEKLRKRYLCVDVNTKRKYYVHALAEVDLF